MVSKAGTYRSILTPDIIEFVTDPQLLGITL